jgi:hypothetical protein
VQSEPVPTFSSRSKTSNTGGAPQSCGLIFHHICSSVLRRLLAYRRRTRLVPCKWLFGFRQICWSTAVGIGEKRERRSAYLSPTRPWLQPEAGRCAAVKNSITSSLNLAVIGRSRAIQAQLRTPRGHTTPARPSATPHLASPRFIRASSRMCTPFADFDKA